MYEGSWESGEGEGGHGNYLGLRIFNVFMVIFNLFYVNILMIDHNIFIKFAAKRNSILVHQVMTIEVFLTITRHINHLVY